MTLWDNKMDTTNIKIKNLEDKVAKLEKIIRLQDARIKDLRSGLQQVLRSVKDVDRRTTSALDMSRSNQTHINRMLEALTSEELE